MKTRIQTAGILILALIILAWIDIYILNFAIFAVILGIAMMESFKLYKMEESDFVFLGVGLFILFAVLGVTNFAFTYKFIIASILVVTSYLAFKNSENLKPLYPIIYPMAPIFVMFSIYDILGMTYLIYLVVIIACADSGAYFTGKLIGMHKFSQTSPNKTIEGIIGGIVAAIFGGGIYYGIFMDAGNLPNPLLSTICIVVAGVFGDLFESYLKRRADVKDSGDLFPGHGGMLDRIDSYLFASVVMSLIYIW